MSRMWMVDPTILCRQHLLGEHKEIHQILGSIKQGHSIQGYIDNNCIEPSAIFSRHKKLVEEMYLRGYNHQSPIDSTEFVNLYNGLPESIKVFKIDREQSKMDLINRCLTCKQLSEI